MQRLRQNEFVERFQNAARPLWSIAAAVLGGPDEAEDVVQEAAMIAFSKRSDFDPDTNFTAWAGQIVRNVARNSIRSRSRRNTHMRLVPGPTESTSDARISTPSTPAESRAPIASDGSVLPYQESFDDQVLDALQTIDETPRTCLLLRVVHDMPYKDIARVLDIPAGTVMSHVHRARKTMVVSMDQQNDTNDRTSNRGTMS